MSWQRVRGHDDLVRAFDRVVRQGRLAHAYLFAGPPGVGKRLFAQELARALLCERRGDRLEACDQCPSCHQVEAGTHPDLFTAGRPEEKLELPIAVMLELCRNFSLKSARGRGKVAIIDDVDDFNDESANCFLKTLEEPPPGSVILLIGSSADLQLDTVLSRCQLVRFAPLPEELVAELLRGQGVEDESLIPKLARLSGGSVGQALDLADPSLWQFRRRLLEGLTQPVPDSVGLAQEWVRFLEEAGKESSAHRRRTSVLLRLLLGFLGDAVAVSVGRTPKLAEPEDLRLLEGLAERLGTEKLLALLDRCLEGDYQVDRRAQLVLVVEALLDAFRPPAPEPARSR